MAIIPGGAPLPPGTRSTDPVNNINEDGAFAVGSDINETLDAINNSTFAAEMDLVMRAAGAGGYNNQMQTFLVGMDRFQRSNLPPNSLHSGFTFITRPRLNLQSSAVRQNRIFAPLDVTEPTNIKYMTRCLLDTVFSGGSFYGNGGLADPNAANCPLFNKYNPFMTPLCNGLVGIGGFPDMAIQTLTTDTGFHSEDQTFAIGYDNLSKTYDLSLTFKDIQGGPISALLFYWLYYIHCVTKGIMLAYSDDVDNQRLNYTVSIYRFLVDPSRRKIVHAAKATGCFPVSHPIGTMFNHGESEIFVNSAGKFNVQFKANKVEYNDYAVMVDFDLLTRRYCPDIADDRICPIIPSSPSNNYLGIPYIDTKQGEPRLMFKMPPNSKLR